MLYYPRYSILKEGGEFMAKVSLAGVQDQVAWTRLDCSL
jgi:hypothetical protein